MSHSDRLVGALIITVAVCAMAEVGRLLRFINVGFGLWLIAAPWLLAGASTVASVIGGLIGLAVLVLSLPRGAPQRAAVRLMGSVGAVAAGGPKMPRFRLGTALCQG